MKHILNIVLLNEAKVVESYLYLRTNKFELLFLIKENGWREYDHLYPI